MLYERDYMRYKTKTNKSIILKIIIINTLIFLLAPILFPLSLDTLVSNFLGVNQNNINEGKYWTLLSYGFFHASFLHILSNMLVLFYLGNPVLKEIKEKNFLIFYLLSAVAGGIFYLAINPNSSSVAIGASASVSAILSFFCLAKPEDKITVFLFFILPVSVRPKWLLRIYFLLTLLFILTQEIKNIGAIAHSAHLGGMIFGLIYYKFYKKDFAIFKSSKKQEIEHPDWFKKSKMINSFYKEEPENPSIKINKILDKINAKGFNSLTEKERTFLKKNSSFFEK